MNFTCKKCGSTEVKEVVLGIVQYTYIAGITDDGCLDYGETIYDGGDENRYQCRECGETIRDDRGSIIRHESDIVSFLTKEKGKVKA